MQLWERLTTATVRGAWRSNKQQDMNVHDWDVLTATGFGFATARSVSSAVAMTLIRSSSVSESPLPYYLQTRWLLGTLMLTVLNPFLDAGAYALAPLALIAPLGGLTLLISVLMARFGFAGVQETPTLVQWMFFVGICASIGMSSAAGPHENVNTDLLVIDARFTQAPFWPWYVLTIGILSFWTTLSAQLRNRHCDEAYTKQVALTDSAMAGLAGAHAAMLFKLILYAAHIYRSGAYTLHAIRSLPSIAVSVWTGIPVVVAQLYLLNAALSRTSICLGVPVYLSVFSLLTMANGCLLFHEIDGLGPTRVALYFGGSALCLVCVIGLGVLHSLYEQRDIMRMSLVEEIETSAVSESEDDKRRDTDRKSDGETEELVTLEPIMEEL